MPSRHRPRETAQSWPRVSARSSVATRQTSGRILTRPAERGRSPPAARRSVEVVWSIPAPFYLLCCCGPGLRRAEVASATQAGRSAVRRCGFQNTPETSQGDSSNLQLATGLWQMKDAPRMNRIVERFARIRKEGKKGFMVYIGAGDSNHEVVRRMRLAFD